MALDGGQVEEQAAQLRSREKNNNLDPYLKITQLKIIPSLVGAGTVIHGTSCPPLHSSFFLIEKQRAFKAVQAIHCDRLGESGNLGLLTSGATLLCVLVAILSHYSKYFYSNGLMCLHGVMANRKGHVVGGSFSGEHQTGF